MVRHVLVPLDGSTLAEWVLPAAAAMAMAFRARVTLFHAIEDDAPETIHGQPHLTEGDTAQAYLEAVAHRPVFRDLSVECHVHRAKTGDVADSLVAHAAELGADLVVLATHGRSGVRGFLFGRIAQRALQRGTTPILLINPSGAEEPPPFVCRNILVPLDGTSAHEPSVPVAAWLATAFHAAVSLLMVVPTAEALSGHEAATGSLMPLATRAVLDLAEREAAAYVQAMAGSLTADGVSSTSYVSRGEPVASLVEAAKAVNADLVVMATHAKAPLDAFWSGSLTPKAMETLERPLLLVRAAPEAPSRG
jgi:nucleotide-binding universal stress UspA family protein